MQRIKTALGFSQSLPSEKVLNSKQEIIHEIAVCLGGRLVENKINNNLVTTGAADDLRKIKNLAMKYINTFGFDSKIGSFVAIDDNGNALKDDDTSDMMKYNMEERCIELINSVEKKAKDIINTNFIIIEKLATKLLEKKRLFKNDIIELIGVDLKKSKVITI